MASAVWSPVDAWPARPGVVAKAAPTIATPATHHSGSGRVSLDRDGWTVRTADGTLSAHYEHTVVITKGEPLVLTAA